MSAYASANCLASGQNLILAASNFSRPGSSQYAWLRSACFICFTCSCLLRIAAAILQANPTFTLFSLTSFILATCETCARVIKMSAASLVRRLADCLNCSHADVLLGSSQQSSPQNKPHHLELLPGQHSANGKQHRLFSLLSLFCTSSDFVFYRDCCRRLQLVIFMIL